MNKMIGISEVSKLTGVTVKTLKIWDNKNKLISIVTCFSSRLYGARSGRKLKGAIKELERERGSACENNY